MAVSKLKYNVIKQGKVVTILDTTRFVFGETPTPATDGATVVFTCANGYVAGSLQVWQDQLTQQTGVDFNETTPGAGTFTMTTAPDSDEAIWVNYIKA